MPAPAPPPPAPAPTQEDRIASFVQGVEHRVLQTTRCVAGALAGEMAGVALGSLLFTPIGVGLHQLAWMWGAMALMGAGGAAIGAWMQHKTTPAPSAAKDAALSAAGAIQALPHFAYPDIVAATPAEKAAVIDALDRLPLSDVTSVSTFTVYDGLNQANHMNIAGVTPPLGSQTRIILDRESINDSWFSRELVTHEVGHSHDYSGWFTSWHHPFVFGHAPFVSDYARTNHLEDFAETHTWYHLRPDELRAQFPEKYHLMDASEHRDGMQMLLDRPAIREAGKTVANTLGMVPYLRMGIDLAGAMLGPLRIARGCGLMEQGQSAAGKTNLASGLLLAIPGCAPLSLVPAFAGIAMQGMSPKAADKMATGMLTAACGPVGMIAMATGNELRRTGIDPHHTVPGGPQTQDTAPAALHAVLATVGGSAVGSLIGMLLGGPTAAGAGMSWGRWIGAATGAAAYTAIHMARQARHRAAPSPLDLTREDKKLLTGVIGGAAVAGIGGAIGGGYLGSAAGTALGAALGGPIGAALGGWTGQVAGLMLGSLALAPIGARVGHKLVA